MKLSFLKNVTEDVSVEFSMLVNRHVPTGWGTNSPMTHPFTVFVWTRNGHGKTVYYSQKSGTHERPENSVVYIAANSIRRSIINSENGAYVAAAGFSFEYLGGANFLNRFQVPSPLPEEIQKKMRVVLADLINLEKRDIPAYRKKINRKAVGYSLLALLLDCAEELDVQEREQEWKRLAPAIQYLNWHFRKPFDVAELIKQTPYSRVHFYRLFKKSFHVSPKEYVLHLRIHEATHLLLETDLCVSEIGRTVGWENQFYFSRIFKKTTGVSPLQYRKKPTML